MALGTHESHPACEYHDWEYLDVGVSHLSYSP
jgi:hypothetical protein